MDAGILCYFFNLLTVLTFNCNDKNVSFFTDFLKNSCEFLLEKKSEVNEREKRNVQAYNKGQKKRSKLMQI